MSHEVLQRLHQHFFSTDIRYEYLLHVVIMLLILLYRGNNKLVRNFTGLSEKTCACVLDQFNTAILCHFSSSSIVCICIVLDSLFFPTSLLSFFLKQVRYIMLNLPTLNTLDSIVIRLSPVLF